MNKTFSTEYRRLQFYERLGTLISPYEVFVGFREEFRCKNSGFSQLSNTVQIIPISKVLGKIFTLKNVLEDTLKYKAYLDSFSVPVENVIQGKVWKCMETKFDQDCFHFPLILYFNDFEINNPLSSHNCVQKLGGVYIALPLLPRKYFSLLNNIFLLGLFHSSDRANVVI